MTENQARKSNEHLETDLENLQFENERLKQENQKLKRELEKDRFSNRQVNVAYCDIKSKYDKALPILLALEEFSVKMIKARQHLDKLEVYGVDKDVAN